MSATAESETIAAEPVDGRTAELAENLAGLNKRIGAACRVAGRDPASVRLLPVTKFFPAADVAILHRLGCREFGESREQEATAKAVELGGLVDVRWHMIGRLQRNKARTVARWAYAVHSVDSERLAMALDTAARAAVDAGSGPTRSRCSFRSASTRIPAAAASHRKSLRRWRTGLPTPQGCGWLG